MGKNKLEGEDIEDLGLTLIADDDSIDVDDLSIDDLLSSAQEDSDVIEIVLPLVDPLDSPDEISDKEDTEEDLLSQLEEILAPSSHHEYDADEAPTSTTVRKKSKQTETEDDDFDAVQPKQKNEVHCGVCYILVKRNIQVCPLDDDSCPVACKATS
jgi:hypothetical protein